MEDVKGTILKSKWRSARHTARMESTRQTRKTGMETIVCEKEHRTTYDTITISEM